MYIFKHLKKTNALTTAIFGVLLAFVLLHCSPPPRTVPDAGTSGRENAQLADGETGTDQSTASEHSQTESNAAKDSGVSHDQSPPQDSALTDTNSLPEPVIDQAVGNDPGAHDRQTQVDTANPKDTSTANDPGAPDTNPAGAAFYLYADDTNQFLTAIPSQLSLKPYASYKMLNIALKVGSGVQSVQFTFDTLPPRSESAATFTVFVGGADHRDKLTLGTHTVKAVTYSGTKLTGRVIDRLSLTFTITDTGGTGGTGHTLPKDPNVVPPDPTFSNTKNVTQTIVITKPGVYDYKNVLHIWKGSGSCNQTENQPHILRIQSSNVTVKNFAYRNAPDGIHIATCGKGQGNTCSGSITNITLDNVVGWACEDALTTGRGTSNITIKNSMFMGNPNVNFRDKCIQVNFGENLLIDSTIFKNCKRPVRFKSGSKIQLKNNRFYLFQHAVKGDTYKDITNIVPDRLATITAENNHYQDGSYAFYMEGKIKVTSTNDVFRFVKTQKFTKDGASVTIK